METQLKGPLEETVIYDGSPISTENIVNKDWRGGKLKELAIRCTRHQKELDDTNSAALGISSMMFTLAKGLSLSKKPDSYTTMTPLEKEQHGVSLQGFFTQELLMAESYIKESIDSEVNFTKKSGTWASVVSRINSCLQYGVDFTAKDTFGNWEYNTVKDVLTAKKDMKEAKEKASNDNAVLVNKAEKDQTVDGKLENYKAAVVGEFQALVDKCKTKQDVFQIFIHSKMLDKVYNGLLSLKRIDDSTVSELHSVWENKRTLAQNPVTVEDVANTPKTDLEAAQEGHREALAKTLDHNTNKDDNPLEVMAAKFDESSKLYEKDAINEALDNEQLTVSASFREETLTP